LVLLGGKNLEVTAAASTFAGAITGTSGSLSLSGGTLTLSGANGYGNTTVTAATLATTKLIVTGNLGYGSYNGNIALTDANTTDNVDSVIEFANSGSTFTQILNGVISGAGKVVQSGASTLKLTGASTYTGSTTVTAGNILVTGTLGSGLPNNYVGDIALTGGTSTGITFEQADNQTLSGDITGTSGTLTQNSVGQILTLSGDNSAHTGAVNVLAGTIQIGDTTNLGAGALTLGGVSTKGTLSVTGNTAADVNIGSASITFGTGGGVFNIEETDFDTVIGSGTAFLTGNYEKTGDGRLTLTADNSAYAGTGTIKAGTLSISDANQLGGASAQIVIENATLEITADTEISATYAAIALNAVSGKTASIAVASGKIAEISSVITGSATNFAKTDAGTLTLSGANTFTITDSGRVLLNAGNLALANNAALGNAANILKHASTGQLEVTHGVTIANKIDVNTAADRSFFVKTAGDLATLTGTITETDASTGLFVKTGAGELFLDNAATLRTSFDNGVKIAAGTLAVSAAFFDNALTNVADADTFKVQLPAATSAFNFGEHVGTAFTGTILINKGTLTLADNTLNGTAAIRNLATVKVATILELGANGTAVIPAGERVDIQGAGLVSNGGTLEFTGDFIVPNFPAPDSPALTVATLDIDGGITLQFLGDVTLPDIPTNPGTPQNILDESVQVANGNGIRIVASVGSTVSGAIALLGLNSDDQSFRDLYDVVDSDGIGQATPADRTGVARFGVGASVDDSSADQGIYINYGLLEITALNNKVVTLDIEGAKNPALAVILSSQTTGAANGGFTFRDSAWNSGDPVRTLTVGDAASNYTGNTVIDALGVTINNSAAFGAPAELALINSAELTLGAALTVTKLNGEADTKIAATGTTLTVDNSTPAEVNASSSGEFAGVLSGTNGNLAVIDDANFPHDATLTLSGTNTYDGGTTVSGTGILALKGTGSIASSSGVELSNTAKFDITALTNPGTAVILALTNASDADTGTEIILGANTLQIGTSVVGGNGNFAGTITGTGALAKSGLSTSELTLSGNNTFSGGTTLTAGKLILGSNTALGTWSAGDPDVATAGLITVNGTATLTDATGVSPVITNHIEVAATGALTLDGTESLTISGVENNSSSTPHGGAVHVDGNGGGTLTLTGNVTFTGNKASFAFAAGGAIYTDQPTLTINAGATFIGNSAGQQGGAINFGGNTLLTFDTSGGKIVFTADNVANGVANAVHSVAPTLLAGIGALYFDSPIVLSNGSVATLTKSGTGSVQFGGTVPSSVSGNILVSGGTVRVLSGASLTTTAEFKPYAIGTPVTIAGAGTIAATTGAIIGEATLAPDSFSTDSLTDVTIGNNYGQLTFTAPTFDLTVATLAFDVNGDLSGATVPGTTEPGVTHDSILVNGTVSFTSGGNAIAVNYADPGAALRDEGTYVLLSSTNDITYGGYEASLFSGATGVPTTTLPRQDIQLLLNAKTIELVVTNNINLTIDWISGDGAWDTTTAGLWQKSSTLDAVNFQAGDAVVFLANGATETIALALGADISVASLTLGSGTRTFTGADAIVSNSTTAVHLQPGVVEADFLTKKLTLSADAKAIFENTGGLDFSNGIELAAADAHIVFGEGFATTATTANTLAAAITGFGSVETVLGNGGVLTLSGNLSHSGGILATSGKLILTGTNTGAIGDVTVQSAATLSYASDTNLGATGGFGGFHYLNGGTLELTGTSYAEDWLLTGNSTLLVDGHNTAFSGVLADATSSAAAVIKTGDSRLTLTADNLYTGATTVSEGTLALSGATAAIAASSGITVANGAEFRISGLTAATGAYVPSAAENGTIVLALNGSGEVILGGSTLQIGTGTTGGTGSFSGEITGNGGLVKAGTSDSTLVLSGVNSFGGGTQIVAGTLEVQNYGALGVNGVNISPAATLLVTVGAAGTLTNALFGSGLLWLDNSADQQVSLSGGSASFTGDIRVEGGSLRVGVYPGQVVGSTYSLGTAAIHLGYGNTDASLVIGEAGVLAFAGSLDLGSHAITLGTLGATIDVADASLTAVLAGTIANETAFGDEDSALTKSGAGTLQFAGTSTYSGLTQLAEGTLALSGTGSIASASGIVLAANTTLDIAATTAGATVQSLESTASDALLNLGQKTLSVESLRGDKSFAGTLAGGDAAVFSFNANDASDKLTLANNDAIRAAFTGGLNVAAGILELVRNDDTLDGGTTLANKLTGSGTLLLSLDNAASTATGALVGGSTFDFATAAIGADFTGTLELPKGRITLTDTNAAALAQATLKLGTDAAAVIPAATAALPKLGGLATNGGALDFTANPVTPDALLKVGVLDFANAGTVVINDMQATAIRTSTPPAIIQNILDYPNDYQLLLVEADSVLNFSDGGSVAWKPFDPSAQSATQTRLLKNSLADADADATGVATFGLVAGAVDDSARKGLYLGYGLLEIEAYAAKSVTLDLEGAKTTPASLGALLSGNGGFTFTDTTATGGVINVGHTGGNTYTGATRIDAGVSVNATTNAALGNTALLTLADAAVLNLVASDGTTLFTQSVGALANEGTDVEIKLGKLTVTGTTGDSVFSGKISGGTSASELAVTGGTLELAGSENTYTGLTRVNGFGANLVVSGALGTDDGTGSFTHAGDFSLQDGGSLTFANTAATQTLTGHTTSNAGNTAITVSGANLVFAGDNSGYSGAVTVNNGATLTLGSDNSTGDHVNNLGSGAGGSYTLDGATLVLTGDGYDKNWTLGTSGANRVNHDSSATFAGNFSGAGDLEINGTGEFTLSGDNTAATGSFAINSGTLVIATDANLNAASSARSLNGTTLVLNAADGEVFAKGWNVGTDGATVAVSGSLTHAGTFATAGALEFAVTGTTTATGTGPVFNPATLVFNGSVESSGVAAAVNKTGAGIFELNGSIAAPFTLAEGTLTGHNGSLGDATFAAGTTIAPGNDANTFSSLRIGGAETEFAGVTLKLDFNATTGQADLLDIAGTSVFGAGNTIEIKDHSATGTWNNANYDILVVESGLNASAADLMATTFTVNGAAIDVTNSRQKAVLVATDTALRLTTYASANLSILWNGTDLDGLWSATAPAQNWIEGDIATNANHRGFQTGDIVAFRDGTGIGHSIEVADAGAVVGAMTIDGNGFIFDGGRIAGVSTLTHGLELDPETGTWRELHGTGALAVNGSATFYNALNFESIAVTGTAVFASTVESNAALLVSGRATLADGGSLDLDASNGTAKLGVNLDGGTLVFDRSAGNDYAFAGAINDAGFAAGSVVKTGGGKLTLASNSSYTGATSVLGGTLAIASDAKIGSGTNTLDGGTLELTGASYSKAWTLGEAGGTILSETSSSFGGALSGPGAFTKTGGAPFVLEGANTYTGTTSVRGGTLEVSGSLGATPTGGFYAADIALNGGGITFNQNGDQTLTGTVAGDGAFVKNGSGTLTLAGTNRVHSVASFRVLSGTANIEGVLNTTTFAGVDNYANLYASNINGDVTNNAGGKIFLPGTGNKTFDGRLLNDSEVIFANYGTTLNIAHLGNVTTGGVGHYVLDVDLDNTDRSDRIRLATGGTVAGRHVIHVRDLTASETLTPDTTYDVIQNAIFEPGSVVTLDLPILVGMFEYNIVGVENGRIKTVGYSSSGTAAINTAGTVATGWYSQLDNIGRRMGDLRIAAPAVTQRATDAWNLLPATFADALAGAHSNDFWVRAYGQQVKTDFGIANVPNFRENQYGADVGIDHAFALSSDSVLFLGINVGYQSSDRTFFDAFGSDGSGESIAGGVYASWLNKDGWFADAALKAQQFSNEFDAAGDHGEFDNYGFGVAVELGKRIDLGTWFLEPSAQFSFSHITAEDYTTAGRDGALPLRVDASDSDLLRYSASVRAGHTFDLGGQGVLEPFVRAGVEYQDSFGGRIRVAGMSFRPDLDGLRVNVGIGAAWQLTDRQQVHLEFDASYGDTYDKPWGINAGYRLRF
jgi:autotransporter-associated beta strand protein